MSDRPNPHAHPQFDAFMAEILGSVDPSGLQLMVYLKIISRLIKQLLDERLADNRLSLARIRLLLRLTLAKRLGNVEGMLPSELSRELDVGRNTISALLNGLEEQGYIERHNHPVDRRQVLIRITDSGEAVVREYAPETADFVNQLFTLLTPEEQATLHTLAEKLYAGLRNRMGSETGSQGHGKPDDTR